MTSPDPRNSGNSAEDKEQRAQVQEDAVTEDKLRAAMARLAKAEVELAGIDDELGYSGEAHDLREDAAGLYNGAADAADREIEDKNKELKLNHGRSI